MKCANIFSFVFTYVYYYLYICIICYSIYVLITLLFLLSRLLIQRVLNIKNSMLSDREREKIMRKRSIMIMKWPDSFFLRSSFLFFSFLFFFPFLLLFFSFLFFMRWISGVDDQATRNLQNNSEIWFWIWKNLGIGVFHILAHQHNESAACDSSICSHLYSFCLSVVLSPKHPHSLAAKFVHANHSLGGSYYKEDHPSTIHSCKYKHTMLCCILRFTEPWPQP